MWKYVLHKDCTICEERRGYSTIEHGSWYYCPILGLIKHEDGNYCTAFKYHKDEDVEVQGKH